MHRPTTVIMARPIAWPMIRPMESSVLATALAEVCMVPKGAIIPTTTTRPSWNRQFSRAEGTPMPKIRLSISGCSRATYCGIRQTSCFGLEASPIMIPAATPRETSVGIATPATPICKTVHTQRIAAHIDPVHHQTGLHGDLAVSRTAENGRSRVVQRQEGKGQGGNAEVSQTGLHHIGGNRPEEEPEQTTRQDQTGSHDAQTEHGGQEHQLPCALPSLLLPPRPQKLAGNHGAAGGQGGKQVQNDVVDHVHQGHTGYGGLSHSGDHHPVAHAHQGRQGLLHHQRKNQPDQRPV